MLLFVMKCHRHSCWVTHGAWRLGEFPFQIRLVWSFLLRACGSWSQGPASPTWPLLLLIERLAPKRVILGSLLKLMNCLPEVNEGCPPTPASGWQNTPASSPVNTQLPGGPGACLPSTEQASPQQLLSLFWLPGN